MTHCIIFGDTGGHYKALHNSVESLLTENHKIPDDTVIIHLGDLIHRGPNSDLVVGYVDALMKENFGQWIQLMGNHEAMHLGLGQFYKCNCSYETTLRIQEWYSNNLITPVAGAQFVHPQKWTKGNRPLGQEDVVQDLLFTHGGLTQGYWKRIGSPYSVEDAVDAIQKEPFESLVTPGEMIIGITNRNAGPIWASNQEVFDSWMDSYSTPPFSQIIGHSSPFYYDQQTWRVSTSKIFRKASKAVPSEDARRVVTNMKGEFLISCDPDYGAESPHFPQPYVSFNAEEIISL